MFEQVVELRLERAVGLRLAVLPLKLEDQRHQRFGDVATAIIAEMPALVGHGSVGVGYGLVHALSVPARREPVKPLGSSNRLDEGFYLADVLLAGCRFKSA